MLELELLPGGVLQLPTGAPALAVRPRPSSSLGGAAVATNGAPAGDAEGELRADDAALHSGENAGGREHDPNGGLCAHGPSGAEPTRYSAAGTAAAAAEAMELAPELVRFRSDAM